MARPEHFLQLSTSRWNQTDIELALDGMKEVLNNPTNKARFIAYFIADELHGSGIDGTWTSQEDAHRVTLYNSFHMMDEWGYYAGWQDFSVVLYKYPKEIHPGILQDCRVYLHDTSKLAIQIQLRDDLEERICYMFAQGAGKWADLITLALLPRCSDHRISTLRRGEVNTA